MRGCDRIIEVENIEDEILALVGPHPINHPTIRFEKINPTLKIKSEISGLVRNIVNEVFR
jgi:hypothetical protein